jgi:hypothetical protein
VPGFCPAVLHRDVEVLDLLGTGLRGQGASAVFGPEPIELGSLSANALIEAAPGGIDDNNGLRKRLSAMFD